MHRYRRVNRRIYRLYAPKRREKSLRCRFGERSAFAEAEVRPPRYRSRKDKFQIHNGKRDSRARRFCERGCLVYISEIYPACAFAAFKRRRQCRLPYKAAVRGGQGECRQERRGQRSARAYKSHQKCLLLCRAGGIFGVGSRFFPCQRTGGQYRIPRISEKGQVQSVSAPDVAGVVSAAHACFKAGE